ncbi:replication initiation protein [Embleya hyalina]|uniref:Replication initiation protein n=1 Tax=Embleya hyalina TaxID=516124 RepID=A0A401YUT8_9ACTN|nr:replication initiation protein [Embleya hyalina]
MDNESGATLHRFSTYEQPTGSLLVACGNRRATRCPSCSETYRADTFQLIRAGLTGGKSVPESVRSHSRAFVTLTAPSFGAVHNRAKTPAGKLLACRCGKHHPDDDPALGTPLNPGTYDYVSAVLWNAHSGKLWARFTTLVRRRLAALGGLTQRELPHVVRVSFAKVAEYQRRGSIHFHAVIRLDGPLSGQDPAVVTEPPSWATADVLAEAVRDAACGTRLRSSFEAVGPREYRWGEQLDIRPISELGSGELTDRAVAGYVAKYATKGAEVAGTVDRSLCCRRCSGVGSLLRGAPPCHSCDGSGLARPIETLDIDPHARRMIRACWDLGGLVDLAGLNLRKWAHMLGFAGHFSTKSRRYSTTLGALRSVRTDWRAEQVRALHGLPNPCDGSTLVVGHWAFAGSGHTPGEALLAAGVRRDLDLNRRTAKEELAAERAA